MKHYRVASRPEEVVQKLSCPEKWPMMLREVGDQVTHGFHSLQKLQEPGGPSHFLHSNPGHSFLCGHPFLEEKYKYFRN